MQGVMECEIGTDAEAKKLVAAALAGQLTDEQAEVLAGLGHGLLSLVLLASSKRIAELESKLKVAAVGDPATPSGQKPLYYAVKDGLLLFASEIKAIHASGLVPKELDRDSLKSYLTYGFVVGEHTLFAGVSKLAAGHVLTVEGGDVETRQYWDLPVSGGASDSLEDAAGRLRELLEASVEKRLMSEVPLGAFLSGGVDSSAVVALMRHHLDEVATF